MTAPTVSVIMASYNGAALIGQTIESVLHQSFPDFELIIVDDCSTDTTRDIIRRYTDPRLRLLSTPTNQGPVGARNLAVAESRGRYLAALDQDDLCLPNRFAAQVNLLAHTPETVACGTATLTLAGGRTGHRKKHPVRTTPGFIHFLLHVANPLVWSSMMIRAETARALHPFSRGAYMFAEDYDLYHRLSEHGKIARIDDVHTIYRSHPAGASHQHRSKMNASATAILTRAYHPIFGPGAVATAHLMISHIANQIPVADSKTLGTIDSALTTLATIFTADADPLTRAMIKAECRRHWWGMRRTAMKAKTLPLTNLATRRSAVSALHLQ